MTVDREFAEMLKIGHKKFSNSLEKRIGKKISFIDYTGILRDEFGNELSRSMSFVPHKRGRRSKYVNNGHSGFFKKKKFQF